MNKCVINLIVEETLPISIIDKLAFVELVILGLPKFFNILCSKTARIKLDKLAHDIRKNIINDIVNIKYLATIADCWAHCRKTYSGTTAYWIDPSTLKRKYAALACKHIVGKHTFEVLANEMYKIIVSIKYKVQKSFN